MINPDICHDKLVAKRNQKLSYNENIDYNEWKKALNEKFIELTGIDEVTKNACPINVQIENIKDKGSYTQTRFTFESEVGETVPCYLLVPKTGKKKYPVAITLQGHSTGFHNSIGEPKFERDFANQPRTAFAVQAVEHGYIALAIEQRGMGERHTGNERRYSKAMCEWVSRVALALGRTVLAERMWDVKCAIDALSYFPECDLDKILITGNSGGGTMSYYAACFDERIKLSVPSCAFCPYEESILGVGHCICNYIPSSYKYFEMQDLASLIAPRRLIVVAGQGDLIFPISGVRRGFETVKKIFAKNGVEDNCRLIETPEGHFWCVDIVWNAIDEETKKLGW